jgi:hypothetical protein
LDDEARVRSAGAALAAPATLVGVALALVACGSPYPGATVGQQVQSWARSTGWAATIRTLDADAARVRVVSTHADAAGMRTVCDVLVTDALGANQFLPAPDIELSTILSGAYRAAVAAGEGCLRAAGAPAGLSSRVATELASAHAGYIKAQARVDLLDLNARGGGP